MADQLCDNLKVNQAVTFYPPDGWAWWHIDNGPAGRPIGRLRISHGGNPGDYEIVSILQNGNVGIGVTNPENKLEVAGNVRVLGNIQSIHGDCAEEFDIVNAESVQPGTVMVFQGEGALQPSEEPYDKRVAGVISGAGDFRPGITLDKQANTKNRLPLALSGKVFCKVDAEYEPIAVGDLLTTSSTPGHAMKADDPVRSFGAVIGKALRPLRAGRDLVPMLVSLQ